MGKYLMLLITLLIMLEDACAAAGTAATSPVRKHNFSRPVAIDNIVSVALADSTPGAASPVRKHKLSVSIAADAGMHVVGGIVDSTLGAASPILKAQFSGNVAPRRDIKMSDGLVDSRPGTASPVRKRQFSGSVTSDGGISVSDGLVDSAPSTARLVRIRKFSERVDTKGVSEVSKGLVDSVLGAASPVERHDLSGKIAADGAMNTSKVVADSTLGVASLVRNHQLSGRFVADVGINARGGLVASKLGARSIVRRSARTSNPVKRDTDGDDDISAATGDIEATREPHALLMTTNADNEPRQENMIDVLWTPLEEHSVGLPSMNLSERKLPRQDPPGAEDHWVDAARQSTSIPDDIRQQSEIDEARRTKGFDRMATSGRQGWPQIQWRMSRLQSEIGHQSLEKAEQVIRASSPKTPRDDLDRSLFARWTETALFWTRILPARFVNSLIDLASIKGPSLLDSVALGLLSVGGAVAAICVARTYCRDPALLSET